jgi:orotate phosphoribosyltransferase
MQAMTLKSFQREFLDFIVATEVLRFGRFTLKSGRESPYFFNTGLFNSGSAVGKLGAFYAAAITDCGIPFDMLFGPAYKGIPLAVATAIAMARDQGRDVGYAFNRKEVKDHGEGGWMVGAPLQGNVLIIDDVISSGLSVNESVSLIRQCGATPSGVFIAMDRQERGQGSASAAEEVRQRHGIFVGSIVTLDHLLRYLEEKPELARELDAVRRYREQYGAT